MSRRKGFSLVEVVIAMLILSVVAAGMLTIFAVGRRSVELAGHRIQALDFARETMEGVKGRVGGYLWSPTPDGSLDDSSSGPDHAVGLPAGCELLTIDSGADRSYTVWDVDVDEDGTFDPGEEYKRVTVTVTWTEPQ